MPGPADLVALIIAAGGILIVGGSWVVHEASKKQQKIDAKKGIGGSTPASPDPDKDPRSGYNKYDPKEIEKRYGLKGQEFHKQVKNEILNQAKQDYRHFNKLGNNPDIYLNSDGNVMLRGVGDFSDYSIVTNYNIINFLP